MKQTAWFTFGQQHTHKYNEQTVDKDTVVCIIAEQPREVMVKHFGLKWSMEYSDVPNMEYFPGGIVNIED